MVIDAGSLDWSEINPDIFGSMFQSVIDPEQRGNLGQHYTSPSNIMKVLRPLFIDKLETALEKARGSRRKLEAFVERLQRIVVTDMACGSGNFLRIFAKQGWKFLIANPELYSICRSSVVGFRNELKHSMINTWLDPDSKLYF